MVRALRGTIDQRRATVEVGDLPPAWGDPSAIEQVFANLIGNALNYLDERRSGRVEVFAVDPLETGGPLDGIARGSVVYAVRDNGLGIPDAYKAKVFAVFQRLHGERRQGGGGRDWPWSARVVERHGGRVWFESRAGEGTTFFVALPAAEARASGPSDESHIDLPMVAISSGADEGRDASWEPIR